MSQTQRTGREDFIYLGAGKPSQNCLPLFHVLQGELEFFRGVGGIGVESRTFCTEVQKHEIAWPVWETGKWLMC